MLYYAVMDSSPAAQALATCNAPYESGSELPTESFRLAANTCVMPIPLPKDDGNVVDLTTLLLASMETLDREVGCARCPVGRGEGRHIQRYCSGLETLPGILMLRFTRELGVDQTDQTGPVIPRNGVRITCPYTLPTDSVVLPILRVDTGGSGDRVQYYRLAAATHHLLSGRVGHYTADVKYGAAADGGQWYNCNDSFVKPIAVPRTQASSTYVACSKVAAECAAITITSFSLQLSCFLLLQCHRGGVRA